MARIRQLTEISCAKQPISTARLKTPKYIDIYTQFQNRFSGFSMYKECIRLYTLSESRPWISIEVKKTYACKEERLQSLYTPGFVILAYWYQSRSPQADAI